MRAYLASGFNRRRTLRIVEKMLENRGIENVASWIHIDDRPNRGAENWPKFAEEIARHNMIDLHKADVVFIDTAGIRVDNGGGVHTEYGYALGKSLPIFMIGKPGRNSFQHLDGTAFNIRRFDSWEHYLSDVLGYTEEDFDLILSGIGIYLGEVDG